MTKLTVTQSFGPDGRRILTPDGIVPTRTAANFVNFGTSGVTYYRSLLPAKELGSSIYIRDGDGLDPRLVIGAQDTPVVVYSMPRLPFMFEEVAELLSKGVKVIADCDDWLRGFMGKEDHPNAEKYVDEYVDAFEGCVSICDLVTCSTQFIADKFSAMGVDTVVIPNGIDVDGDRWQHSNREYRRNRKANKLTIIGWSGSIGHDDAFKAIVPQLERVLRENPDARFASVGLPMMEHIDPALHGQCAALPFVMFPEHPKAVSQFHINLGPTLPHDFYRSKSDLRLQEAWTAGQCFVGGPESYGDSVDHGVNGFICQHGTDDYYDILTELVQDRALLNRIGVNGLASRRTIAQTGVLWKSAIQGLIA